MFVDDALVPFHDQWAFLAGIRPIDPGAVEAIADEGTRRGDHRTPDLGHLGPALAGAGGIWPQCSMQASFSQVQ